MRSTKEKVKEWLANLATFLVLVFLMYAIGYTIVEYSLPMMGFK